jgi:hypothetical protein
MRSTRETHHARLRLDQRAIRPEVWSLFMEYADRRTPAGSGCERLRLSHAEAHQLIADGVPLRVVLAASTITAIMSPDGAVITAYRNDHREYRRVCLTAARRRR